MHGVRQTLAHHILHVPESRIRVVARDVGGGFGMKGNVYPEEAILVWAARRVGRPVKWIPTRSEALLGDYAGRDQNVAAELALDAGGKFLALRWTGAHNIGAYIEGAGAIPIIFSLKLAPTVYDIPAVSVTSSLVFTNTAPTVPYRGAGRPEAVYIMERLVDQAAREMHIDPAELRKRNLIRPDAYPYRDAHRLDLRHRELRRGDGQVPGPGRLGRLCGSACQQQGRGQTARPRHHLLCRQYRRL